MKKASVETTFSTFHYWMDFYINLFNKIFHDSSPFTTKREKSEIIEGFVFKVCSQWDILVEELLIDCLNRDSSAYAKHMALPLPKHIPRAQCKAMIIGLGYLDFKGVNDIQTKSKPILVEKHNPFSSIKNNDKSKIEEFFKIRNYIAHYSTVAERSLKKMYKETYKLQRFSQPGAFLLTFDSKAKSPRIQQYINAFISASEAMEEKLGIELDE